MKTSLLPIAFAAFLVTAGASGALADTDGDGFNAPIDCDDNNNQVYPGAPEIVGDGIDEDCNAQEICYVDMDDDGYRGSAASPSADTDCNDIHEALASDPSGDCDDSNAAVHPGAVEVCDASNVDEDCDGGADNLDAEGASGTSTWYADLDGDGYGDGATSFQACDAPSNTSSNAGDCDDASSSINPGGTETCDPADVDEDCDGFADDTDGGGATGKDTYYYDNDMDGYGGASTPRCDPSPGMLTTGGDCDDAHATAHPGGTETCTDTYDNDCNGQIDCLDSVCSSDAACLVEVVDHIECYKIKTTEKLSATIDLDPGSNPPFTAQNGCTIKKASKFCIPVMKTVSALESNLTADPTYQGVEQTDMRVCYKMKCPDQTLPVVTVHDQFGTRSFEKFKVTEICTPAEIVP